MIPQFRARFNRDFRPDRYAALLAQLERECGIRPEFRIAETPIFLPAELMQQIAQIGSRLCLRLVADQEYLAQARLAIPAGYRVDAETSHPNFLVADFALIRTDSGELAPRLVEMQGFPSLYAYQSVLNSAYRDAFSLDSEPDSGLGSYLSGLDEAAYWQLFRDTVVGEHDPKTVVLTEVDPFHQKTRPDFEITGRRLGIAVVDIAALEPQGDRLTYRDARGRSIPVHCIYNRAIADELMARRVRLAFDLERPWNVEWAGHPNWYFLISKFSVPFLCRPGQGDPAVPSAVFLDDFLAGKGRRQLEEAGVSLPAPEPDAVYHNLLLKPLFSFAGKGIQFDPAHSALESIPAERRTDYMLQQRMTFVPTIETPHGPTQAEIRILYLWPDHGPNRGQLIAALSLVRLGRGRMMGVDHNRNLEWVGASGAFFPIAV